MAWHSETFLTTFARSWAKGQIAQQAAAQSDLVPPTPLFHDQTSPKSPRVFNSKRVVSVSLGHFWADKNPSNRTFSQVRGVLQWS